MTRCCPSSQKAEVFFFFSLDWGCKLFSQPLQRSNNRPPVPWERGGGSAWRERGIRHAARTRGRLVGKSTQREMTEKRERERGRGLCSLKGVFSLQTRELTLWERRRGTANRHTGKMQKRGRRQSWHVFYRNGRLREWQQVQTNRLPFSNQITGFGAARANRKPGGGLLEGERKRSVAVFTCTNFSNPF